MFFFKVTHQSITGTYGCASLSGDLIPHLAQEVALGGAGGTDPGPVQAAVPPLRQEARCQQARVEGEVKVQTVAAVPQLVVDSIPFRWTLGGFPPLDAANMVRQEVGQEVTSGIHSGGVNHIMPRQIPQKSLCESDGGKRRWVNK